MKHLILLVMFAFSATVNYAQSDDKINQALNLLNSYWQTAEEEQKMESLTKVEQILKKAFEKSDGELTTQAHFAQAQLLTAQILHPEFEDPESVEDYVKDIKNSFDMALSTDSRKSYRYFILEKLYRAKAKLSELGAAEYTKADYKDAYQYYDSSIYLNDLEIKYPRQTRPDTSTIYTTAVVAKLAGETEKAIQLFQGLVDMEYNRPDIYDYLIDLYDREKFDVKAKKTQILKNKRFPEN